MVEVAKENHTSEIINPTNIITASFSKGHKKNNFTFCRNNRRTTKYQKNPKFRFEIIAKQKVIW